MYNNCTTGQRSLFLYSHFFSRFTRLLFGRLQLISKCRHWQYNWSAFSYSQITFLFSWLDYFFLARHLFSIISLANLYFANLVLFLSSSKYFAVFSLHVMFFLTFFHRYMFLSATERHSKHCTVFSWRSGILTWLKKQIAVVLVIKHCHLFSSGIVVSFYIFTTLSSKRLHTQK